MNQCNADHFIFKIGESFISFLSPRLCFSMQNMDPPNDEQYLYYSTTSLEISGELPTKMGSSKIFFRHQCLTFTYLYNVETKILEFSTSDLGSADLDYTISVLEIENVDPSKSVRMTNKFREDYYSIINSFDLSQFNFSTSEKVSMKFYCYFLLPKGDEEEPTEDVDAHRDITEKCWKLTNFSAIHETYKSTPINVNGTTFHYEFTIPDDQTKFKNDPFTLSFIPDQVDSTIKLKLRATILNQLCFSSLKQIEKVEVSSSDDINSIIFDKTFSEILDPKNGFILNDSMYISIYIKNYSYTTPSYTYTYAPKTYENRSKEETGFVGLQNQGATCYLDSMLQSLYHLPAFRHLVYQMPTTGTEDVRTSIPLNLQRLFTAMQLGDKPCSTKALTVSFGWDDHSTFVQHDTQEFCRVLLDNLEEKMKVEPQLKGKIAQLFSGKYKSYIRCINVDYESSRIENFYDVALAIKGCKNIEECFKKYIETETLDGDNQYDTGDGGFGKQDAKMGIEFVELPPVLQLHLGRFEFNYDFDRNIKINDRLEFPLVLDMNEYVKTDGVDNTYDLYGVLVHSGSVSFGHYYAFLRPGMTPQWLEFNDSFVSKVEETTAVNNNFGTATSSNGYEQSFSAYILVYVRRQDIDWIFKPVSDEDIPEHLREFFEHPEKFKQDQSDSDMFDMDEKQEIKFVVNWDESISVNCLSGKTGFTNQSIQKEFTLPCDQTQLNVYEKVASLFNRPIDEIRLLRMDYYYYPYSVFSDSNFTKINLYTTDVSLFLQFKKPDEPVIVPYTSIILFIKFFNPELEAPLQYIGSIIVSSEETTQAILFQKMNEILGAPKETEYDIYNETVAQQKVTKLAYAPSKNLFDARVTTGSTLIFQVKTDNPIHFTYQFKQPIKQEIQQSTETETDNQTLNENQTEIESQTKTKIENENETENQTKIENENETNSEANDENENDGVNDDEVDCPIYSYELVAKNVEDYYNIKLSGMTHISLYPYDDLSKPICKLIVTDNLSTDEFTQFIVSKLNLQYNPNTDLILFYKPEFGSTMPTTLPIDSKIYSTVKSLYPVRITQQSTVKENILFYKLVKGITKDELISKIIPRIQLSKDAVNILNAFYLPLDFVSTYEDLVEKVNKVIQDEHIDFDMNHESIRIFSIGRFNVYEPGMKIPSNTTQIRIEYVPEDQKITENERLIPFTMSSLGKSSYTRQASTAVLFKVNQQDSIQDVKEKISQVFNLNEEQMKKVKLFAGYEYAHVIPKKVLADDIKFETIPLESTIFILLNIKKNQISYRRKEEALKIEN